MNACWPFGFLDQIGVHDQDASPGREAVPGAVLGLELGGVILGVFGVEGLEQALLLEAQGVEDLVVPEEVATGGAGLGDDPAGEAEGLGALGVEDGGRSTWVFPRYSVRTGLLNSSSTEV